MKTGELGEEVVAQWLLARGGKILQRRWRWKRGEIDLIALESNTLLFIEVKTRNRRNWDEDGLLAINPQKQFRIIQTAQLFLLKHPHLAEYACRFDAAIVRHQPIVGVRVGDSLPLGTASALAEASPLENREIDCTYLHTMTDIATNECLLLIKYIPNAFDGV
jgi:putative endonuclease